MTSSPTASSRTAREDVGGERESSRGRAGRARSCRAGRRIGGCRRWRRPGAGLGAGDHGWRQPLLQPGVLGGPGLVDHGQVRQRCTSTASSRVVLADWRRGHIDFAIGQPARRWVELHGHVGDLALPGHQRRPQGLGDGGHRWAEGVAGRIPPGRVLRRSVDHVGHTQPGGEAARPLVMGNRATMAAIAGVGCVAAARGGRPVQPGQCEQCRGGRTIAAPRGLRRRRAAFGPIEVAEVVRHCPVVSDDPEDDRLGGHRGAWGGSEGGWQIRGG
jgi:hypothetical protein